MTIRKALQPRDDLDRLYKCEEKKEEVDLPVVKTVLTLQYNYLKTTLKSLEKD